MSGIVTIICKNCGKPFENYKSAKRIFCSNQCYHKWTRGEKHPGWKEKIEKTCLCCGRVFEVLPCKSNKTKYCSQECRIKVMSKIRDVERVKELYKSGLTQREIGEKLGFTQSGISACMRRHGIEKRRFGSWTEKKPLNDIKKITPELGYVIGVCLGDGSIYEYKHGHHIAYVIELWSKDREFVEFFAAQFKKWCGHSSKVKFRNKSKHNKNWSDQWQFRFYGKQLCLFLKDKLSSLDWIRDTPKDFKRMVSRGLFDSEGYVIHSKFWGLGFTVKNKKIIELFQELCRDVGIKAGKIFLTSRGMYKLYIYKDRMKFAKEIGITIKRKRKMLMGNR